MSFLNKFKHNEIKYFHPEASGEDAVATTESLQTTNFVDDGVEKKIDLVTNVDKDLIPHPFDTIVDFLAKPQLVVDGAWLTTDTQTTELTAARVAPLVQLTSYPLWTRKTDGFGYVRGTAHYKLMINAQPFQAGKLVLHFLPNDSNRQASFVAMHNSHLTTILQQPHVILDAGESAAEMAVPFISPIDASILSTVSPDWGTFYVHVLNQLRVGAGGLTSVTYKVYIWFTDIELLAPMLPQAPLSSKTYSARSISREEASKIIATRSISGGLALATNILDSLTSVPLLSSVTSPAAWATDILSGVASALGYSKPLTDEPPAPVTRIIDKYGATSDGFNNSIPLGLIHNNATNLTTGISIRNQDEMSFEFLKRISAPIYFFSWTDADLGNGADNPRRILTMPNTFKNGFNTTKNLHTVTSYVGPPVWYLSHLFKYWRGGFKLKFTFAKTIFHTGRLELTYTPHVTVVNHTTILNSNYAFREIIDLKAGNEFTIHVPYLVPYDWLVQGQYSGELSIVVLNELRNPPTCDATIDCIVYVSGADDFEFAVPNGCGDSAQYTTNGRAVVFSPESGSVENSAIGNTPLISATTKFDERTVGERFTSLRQLLSRHNQIYLTTNPFTPVNENNAVIWPWFAGATSLNAVGVVEMGLAGGDAYSFLSSMYAYYRGSMHVRLSNCHGTSLPVANSAPFLGYVDPSVLVKGTTLPITTSGPTLRAEEGQYASVNYATSNKVMLGMGSTWSDSNTGAPTFHVPYYNRFKCSYTDIQSTAATGGVPNNIFSPDSALVVTCLRSMQYTALTRAIGEDFQFSYFVGCPPLYGEYV
jgi:hypothetical protein